MYFAKSVNEFSFILCVFKVLFIDFTLGYFWEFSHIYTLIVPSVSDSIYSFLMLSEKVLIVTVVMEY